MRITSKGQVTIPKAIRERLGVKPGDEVEFVEVDEADVRLLPRQAPTEKKRKAEAFQRAANTARRHVNMHGRSVDEYMAWIRGE